MKLSNYIRQIISFLKQGTHEKSPMQESINALYALIGKGDVSSCGTNLSLKKS